MPGGHSGLTYRVDTSEGPLVVKSVPPGQKAIGRHDMLRQARILEALDVETAEIRARLPGPEVEETLDRVDERRVALVDLMEELREPADAGTFRDIRRTAEEELGEMALLLAEARLASRTEPAAFDAALDAQVAALADSISASTSAEVQERAAAFGALRDRLHEAEGDAWAERKEEVVEAWIALRRALAEAAARQR